MHWKDNFGAVLTKTKCHAKCVCDENKELVREIVSVQQTAFYEAYWFTNKFSNVMGLLDFFLSSLFYAFSTVRLQLWYNEKRQRKAMKNDEIHYLCVLWLVFYIICYPVLCSVLHNLEWNSLHWLWKYSFPSCWFFKLYTRFIF